MHHTSTSLLHLLATSEGGEDSAWAELIARHQREMRRAAQAAAGVEITEDAVQEAFLQVRRHAGRFRAPELDDGERAARAWLCTISANCGLMLARSNRRRAFHEAAPRPAVATVHAQSPLDAMTRNEERQALIDAMASLSESERRPIVLRYYVGITHKEQLGAALGCSADAAGMRLHRALVRLRKRLLSLGALISLEEVGQRVEASAYDLDPATPRETPSPTIPVPMQRLTTMSQLSRHDVIPSIASMRTPAITFLVMASAATLALWIGEIHHGSDSTFARKNTGDLTAVHSAQPLVSTTPQPTPATTVGCYRRSDGPRRGVAGY